MTMQLAPATAALARTENAFTPVDDLVADAVAACAHARASKIALEVPAEQTLRASREAGRRLSLVQRSDGGRPRNNSSRGLTSYQCALKQSAISRQTACVWRQVAAIPEPDFEQFIVEAKLAMRDLTVAELLRVCCPKVKMTPGGRIVKLVLSDDEYRAFQQHVGVLGTAYFTETATETVMAVLEHAYSGWLAAQIRRSSSKGERRVRAA